MVFECSAFDAIRAARSSLFADAIGQVMRAFMGQPDQRGVFWFVCAIVCVWFDMSSSIWARALP